MITAGELFLIGGRSGVGKSTAAGLVHDLLASAGVRHAVVEGDALDMAHPAPWHLDMAARNLAAIWANYRAEGYERLVYVNTVSVLEHARLAAALGDGPRVAGVLLRGTNDDVAARLGRREHGDSFDSHVARSAAKAEALDARAPAWIRRVETTGRDAHDVAGEVAGHTGWL